jgi:hypothetical protein
MAIWGVIKVGDCTLENGTLQINADGTAIFWGFASTSDDDAWVFRGRHLAARRAWHRVVDQRQVRRPQHVGQNLRMGSSIQLSRGVVRLNHWSTDKPGALLTITPNHPLGLPIQRQM